MQRYCFRQRAILEISIAEQETYKLHNVEVVEQSTGFQFMKNDWTSLS